MTSRDEDDCSSSDDDLLNWQNVTTKRKKIIKETNVHKKQKSYDGPSCSNVNKFADLANDEDDEDDGKDDDKHVPAESAPKPPPIFIDDVTNIKKMIKCVSSVIANTEFQYKGLHNGQVKLSVKTVDSYRKITKHFDTNSISYHTYQLKAERAYRFVIKGLHHTTNIGDIKAHLIEKGHLVRYITNVKSRFNKKPLPMFYVDIDPGPNNKKVFDIFEINHCIVKIEPPNSTEDIVQCHRCQEYGHTKTYCKKPFACVKCGLAHPTINCQKERNDPPKCIHCLGNHTANYKGCQFYQNLLRKRTSDKGPLTYQQFSINKGDFPAMNPNYNNNAHSKFNTAYNNRSGETYANVGNLFESNNIMKNIENLLHKQIELTNTLMNMMSLLINKLCK